MENGHKTDTAELLKDLKVFLSENQGNNAENIGIPAEKEDQKAAFSAKKEAKQRKKREKIVRKVDRRTERRTRRQQKRYAKKKRKQKDRSAAAAFAAAFIITAAFLLSVMVIAVADTQDAPLSVLMQSDNRVQITAFGRTLQIDYTPVIRTVYLARKLINVRILLIPHHRMILLRLAGKATEWYLPQAIRYTVGSLKELWKYILEIV